MKIEGGYQPKNSKPAPDNPPKGFHDPVLPDSEEGKRRAAVFDAAIDKGIMSEKTMNKIAVELSEDRQTFEIPNGCVPVLDFEGRATGGFVAAGLALGLPGFDPIWENGKVAAVRSKSTPKAAMDKMASALSAEPSLLDMEVPGYEPLRRVLEEAYNQSARGKGRERHAKERPFLQQPIMEIGRMVGIGGHTYQISKKAQEAGTMATRGNHAAAKAELLGVIVYAAAAYLLTEESQ